jgi:L-arabinose transport system permease protein
MKRLLEKGGMGLVCVIMILLCAIFVPHFASTNNITALLMSISTIGMVACTMMLCLAAGDFDLSIGSTLALAGVVSAIVINATGNIFLVEASIAMQIMQWKWQE